MNIDGITITVDRETLKVTLALGAARCYSFCGDRAPAQLDVSGGDGQT